MITIESLKQHLPDTGRPWKLVDAHSTIQVYGAIKCRLKQGGYGYQKFAVSMPKDVPSMFSTRLFTSRAKLLRETVDKIDDIFITTLITIKEIKQ